MTSEPSRWRGLRAVDATAMITDQTTVSHPDDITENPTEWRFGGWILQDWAVNWGRPDSRVLLVLFRLGQRAQRRGGFPGRVVSIAIQTLCSLVFGVELPSGCEIGPRLRLYHPHAIVLNPQVRLGADCHLRQSTTIGNVVDRDGNERGSPTIGNGVELGASCVVLGPITVGDQARIGALAVVTKDVPAWGVVVGNPGRVIRIDTPQP